MVTHKSEDPPSKPLLGDFLKRFDDLAQRAGDRAWIPYGSFPEIPRLHVSADMPPSSRLTCRARVATSADPGRNRVELPLALQQTPDRLRQSSEREGLLQEGVASLAETLRRHAVARVA